MLGNKPSKGNSGRISSGIEVDASILAVLDFLETHLPSFANKNKGRTAYNEKGLTEKLIILLNRKLIAEPFFFHNDKMEDNQKGNSPSVDIGVLSKETSIIIKERKYSEDDAFFRIEAKRLSHLGQKREKEYLLGRLENGKYKDTGGIERFKKGIHGRNLDYGGVIGYLQKEDFTYWHNTINTWIDELIIINPAFWKEDDKLEKMYFKNHLSKLRSQNIRMSGDNTDTIELFHFWVDLTS